MKIGINGFGRIGKCVLRTAVHSFAQVTEVQINSSAKIEQLVHALKYDSTHGRFLHKVDINDPNTFTINNTLKCTVTNYRHNIKWQQVDVLIDCTGTVTDLANASVHLKNGAHKVLLANPVKQESNIETFVQGANANLYNGQDVISIGSCTTNCLAPVVSLLQQHFTIKNITATSIHAYTNSQNILDSKHKDFRRARSCTDSIIPTSTGAANVMGYLFPNLTNKFQLSCLRVPVANVSVLDCAITLQQNINASQVNQIMQNNQNNILGTSEEPLVSVDYIGDSRSAIVDTLETKAHENILRVLCWYDNEMGFTHRVLETALQIYHF